MRLLLIEDDPLLGQGVQQGLSLDGEAVDWLRTGQHALDALASSEFDAMILDLGLPDIDGIQVLNELRRRAAEPDRPQIELDYFERLLDRF